MDDFTEIKKVDGMVTRNLWNGQNELFYGLQNNILNV